MRVLTLGISLLALAACDDDASPADDTPPEAGTGCDPLEAARPVTLRRLNRDEYNNTVRDLLGTEARPAEDFPDDNIGYGFDNIGDVLAVSPLLFEKYAFTAETLVDQALAWPRTNRAERWFEAERIGQAGEGELYGARAWDLWASGVLTAKFEAHGEGDYRVTIKAFAKQAGDEVAKMAVLINSAEAQVFEVSATEDAPEDYVVEVPLTPGEYTLGLRLMNEFYDPAVPDPEQRKRRLIIDNMKVDGPLEPSPLPEPESRKALLTCEPAADDGGACTREVLEAFARRAWRGPAEEERLEALLALVSGVVEQGQDWETGVEAAMVAILLSPRFLARFTPEPEEEGVRWLDDHELASRISYFVWSSMPDEALLADADSGSLQDPDVVAAHVRRMLDDPRAKGFVEGFAGQWLNMRAIATVDPDYERFPDFDEELRAAMLTEMEMVFRELLNGDRSLIDLVQTDFTYVNDRLARHYGLPETNEPGFRRVSLEPGGQRYGLLSMAGWLSSTSHRIRASPVRRGKWVLLSLLCIVTPEPPPVEPPLEEEEVVGEVTGTMRERFEAHRKRPECATCHKLIDPIGFALENYDAIGKWQDADSGGTIDPTGTMPDGQEFSGGGEMAAILRDDDKVPRCITQQLLTYALGRGTEASDNCTIDQLTEQFNEADNVLEELIVAIATSEAFRARASWPDEEGGS